MKLKKISLIENTDFRSLPENFSVSFSNQEIYAINPKCIVGLNGSGKSTLLQALDLISQMMKGDISNWLRKRNWVSKDLHSKFTKAKNISFKLYLEENEKDCIFKEYIYEAIFNSSKLKCTSESVFIDNNKVIKIENSKIFIGNQDGIEIIQEYEGSLLSSMKENKFEEGLLKLKNFIKEII